VDIALQHKTEQPSREAADAGTSRRPVYSSHRLFGATDAVDIEHEGSRYTLRRTRQGKLLLTK